MKSKSGLILLLSTFLVACEPNQETATHSGTMSGKEPAELHEVRLAMPTQISSALIQIAVYKGFFEEQGLRPVVTTFPSGKRAVKEALSVGKADFATTADIPFVKQVQQHSEIRTIATLFFHDNANQIVVDQRKGINAASDLRGKTVGTQENSTVHHFLDSILGQNNISRNEVAIRYYKAEQLAPALASGEIDAFSMREPFTSQAIELMGDNAIVLSFPGSYIQYELLVANKSYIDQFPGRVSALLSALTKAEIYLHQHPLEAATIISNFTGTPLAQVSKDWDPLRARLQFSQSTLAHWEQLLSWVAAREGDNDSPEITDYIEESYLRDIAPSKVSVIKYD